MADPLLEKILRLQRHIATLQEANRKLTERNKEIEAENTDLRLKADEAAQRLHESQLNEEFLRMSYRLASSPDTIIETRRHIARLIRNIDRCLDMLKE